MRRRILDLAPDAFAVVAEGAWVSAVYALVQAASHGPMPLGPVAFALVAAAGLLVSRRFAPRLGERWPRTALGLVILAGVLGCLAEPSALVSLGRLDIEGALRAHPGGLLAGLAFFRGFAYAAPLGSDVVLERLLQIGLPGLALPVLLTGTLAEPWRTMGLQRELVATVVFLVSATVGVALGRVAGIARSTGFDWRGNRAWLALVALLAIGVVAIAVPISLALAPVLRIILAALVAPLILLGAIAGLSQVRLRQVLSLLLLGAWLLILGFVVAGHVPPTPAEGGGGGIGVGQGGEATAVDIAGGTIIILVIVVGILVLARLWMRDAVRLPGGDVPEERTIDHGVTETRSRPAARRGHPTPWASPVDAATAYVALIHDLESRPTARREPGESPAGHARRLRAAGIGEPGLDRLAADYELARFAGLRLTPKEERRALARWARLRRTLGIAPRHDAGAAS
jgi:hypothetical protein